MIKVEVLYNHEISLKICSKEQADPQRVIE